MATFSVPNSRENTSELRFEFILLMALMTALLALSMDSLLPAFPQIQKYFQVSAEKMPLVISSLFLGFGFGQLLFGPLSDSIGRRPAVHFGFLVFIGGTLLSNLSHSFEVFLISRFLQGFGVSSPRIIAIAMVRDQSSGNKMAKIVSLITTLFILIPVIAPTLGKVILSFGSWRALFVFLTLSGTLVWSWFYFRQKETLQPGLRVHLDFQHVKRGIQKTFTQSKTLASIFMLGCVYGIFVGYLGSVQAIFSRQFHVVDNFPMYFGVLALSIGASSLCNAQLVMSLGVRKLVFYSFSFIILWSSIYLIYVNHFHPLGIENPNAPSLVSFMIYMFCTFFAFGFLFGNLNAWAMEPLGDIAGLGSSLIGFTQTTLAVIIGSLLGAYFIQDISFLVMGFIGVGAIGITTLFIQSKYFPE